MTMSATRPLAGSTNGRADRVAVAVYADGGVLGRTSRSEVGGPWAWCAVDANGLRIHEASGLLLAGPGETVTNNMTEFVAVVQALEWLPDHWCGQVCSDSGVTLGRLFDGWKLTGIPDEWIARGSVALQRLGTLDPLRLDGHPTRAQLKAGIGKRGGPVSPHNCWCDEECNRQKRRYLLALEGETKR